MISKLGVIFGLLLFAFSLILTGCGEESSVSNSEMSSGLYFVNDPSLSSFPFIPVEGNKLIISYKLNSFALTTTKIFDLSDNNIATLTSGDGSSNTCKWDIGCSWDGKNDSGMVVANGMYEIRIQAVWKNKFIEYSKGIVVMNENE